jgi:hypothetical protein
MGICLFFPLFFMSAIGRKTRVGCENWALLGYYATNTGNFLPMFRDHLSVPSSGLKNNPKECSSQLLRGGRLKSRKGWVCSRCGLLQTSHTSLATTLAWFASVFIFSGYNIVYWLYVGFIYYGHKTLVSDNKCPAAKLAIILRTAGCIKKCIFFHTVEHSQHRNTALTKYRQSL